MTASFRAHRRPALLAGAARGLALAAAASLSLPTAAFAEVPWAKPAASKPAAPAVEPEWKNVRFKIDVDEWRDSPRRHRYVHGCFTPSHLCMSIYFPPKELYRGRFVNHMEGGSGGMDKMMTQPGWDWAFNSAFDDMGAYLVETNEGHWPDEGSGLANPRELWIANAHGVRVSRELAKKMYGLEPARGYITGCSGGGVRSSQGLENNPDLYDGAVPQAWSVTTGPIWSTYSRMGMLLGKDGVAKVIDALDVGGSGDPFDGLDYMQREALSDFLKMGWPRDAMRQLKTYWAATGYAVAGAAGTSPYYKDFWTKKGHVGHDNPELLKPYLIETEVTVERVLTVRELQAMGVGGGRNTASATFGPAQGGGSVMDFKPGAYLKYPEPSKLFLAKATIQTGPDAGKTLFLSSVRDDGLVQPFLQVSPWGFDNVKPGDKLKIDNRDYLAYLYMYKHSGETAGFRYFPELRSAESRFLPELQSVATTWGKPIFPQVKPSATNNDHLFPNLGVIAPHQKMIQVSGSADEPIYPVQMTPYIRLVQAKLGAEAENRHRIWWMEGVPHCSGPMSGPGSTERVNSQGIVSQALLDVMNWAENGTPAHASTGYRIEDNQLILASTAAERRGVQPVVRLRANGAARAEVAVGQPVTLTATTEVPTNAGSLVSAEWDFDGQGTWPQKASGVGGASGTYTATFSYAKPGTYFPAVRVASKLPGVSASATPSYNIARARVVVK